MMAPAKNLIGPRHADPRLRRGVLQSLLPAQARLKVI
jgi:hypothetical protein